jgi:hypothetical protein
MLKSEIRRLKADQLMVDPAIQRNLDQRRVAKMASEYDPEAVGVLTVSRRDNGSYHIVDGQHRHAAARTVEGDKVELTCRVFSGLTDQDEARLFRWLNNTAKPQAIDLFRVKVIEGDPAATEIERMITGLGWEIRLSNGGHSFAAITAADRIYRADPTAVERSLATITRAWGFDEIDGRVFEGLGLLYARHGSAIDLGALAERLAVSPGGQMALLGRARGLSDLLRIKVPSAVAEVTTELYNVKRKTKALPAWRS